MEKIGGTTGIDGLILYTGTRTDLERKLRERDDRITDLERDLAARPTDWAYEAACKALWHWRDEAARLAKLAGVEPRQMEYWTEGLQMTDDEAIRIARRSPYSPNTVKIPNGSYEKPHAVIVVDLDAKPPKVTRIDDEYPHLRRDK